VSTRFNKVHPALKHAGYSATTLLPGEDSAAFETLHRALIAEGRSARGGHRRRHRAPWRKQNLATFRIAELAKKRQQTLQYEKVPGVPLILFDDIDPAVAREGYRAAEEQARQELGDIYKLIDIGEPATIEGLIKELDIKERLDGLISKCLKQLLMVRGVKSLSPASSSRSMPQISGPRKAS
jgi:hypothetical protein